MHKRARNHALMNTWRKKYILKFRYGSYKYLPEYEPQGKKEFFKLRSIYSGRANLIAWFNYSTKYYDKGENNKNGNS